MTSRQLEQTLMKVKLFCQLHNDYGSGKTGKSLFIPTPGQYEQLYLAKKLKEDGMVHAEQDDFKIDNLPEVKIYGLQCFDDPDWKKIICVFEI
jgi:hypothetical protein